MLTYNSNIIYMYILLSSIQQRRLQVLNRAINRVRITCESIHNSGFNYDPQIDYSSDSNIIIGRMDKECAFCHALKWEGETSGMCCAAGKVHLNLLEDPPEPLRRLITTNLQYSKHFLKKIRKFNSCFQMTSFGAGRTVIQPGFCPTFKIQGQVYHKIGSLLPMHNEQHNFMQIYFMGNDDDETDRRREIQAQIRRHIIHDL